MIENYEKNSIDIESVLPSRTVYGNNGIDYTVYTEDLSPKATDRAFGYTNPLNEEEIFLFQIMVEGNEYAPSNIKLLMELPLEDDDFVRYLIDKGENLKLVVEEDRKKGELRNWRSVFEVDGDRFTLTYMEDTKDEGVSLHDNYLKRIENRKSN